MSRSSSITELSICIQKNRKLSRKYQDGGRNKDHVSAQVEEVGQVNGDLTHTRIPDEDLLGNETSELSKFKALRLYQEWISWCCGYDASKIIPKHACSIHPGCVTYDRRHA